MADDLARRLKTEGNALFARQDYAAAAAKYAAAIAAAPRLDASFYTNRAACSLKLGQHAAAVDDCTAALEAFPGSPAALTVKALWRRGTAHRELGRLADARADWERALAADPANQSVAGDLNKLAWEEKRAQRSKKDGRRGVDAGSAGPPPAAIVPIEVVDTLPDEFRRVSVSGAVPGPAAAAAAAGASAAPAQPREPVAKKAKPADRELRLTPPARLPNGYALTQLLHRPPAERTATLEYVFSLAPLLATQPLRDAFGRAGIEADMIELVLDSVAHVAATYGATPAVVADADTLLAHVRQCARFAIARVFVDDAKVRRAFAALGETPERAHWKGAGW
ncbi:uncharacterized protein V1510DRAFT_400849 [Dipodascopsis tothii]|uniref:uncharacterized protein n=1 Tax=Dipodascopsis tothii TaxID=44089 RepID=UPI0034CD7CB6